MLKLPIGREQLLQLARMAPSKPKLPKDCIYSGTVVGDGNFVRIFNGEIPIERRQYVDGVSMLLDTISGECLNNFQERRFFVNSQGAFVKDKNLNGPRHYFIEFEILN